MHVGSCRVASPTPLEGKPLQSSVKVEKDGELELLLVTRSSDRVGSRVM